MWYELLRFIWFSNMSEHVQTCLNLFRINMIWIYTILKYCQNMMKYTKCLWCNLIQSYHFLSSLKSYLNMSRLVLNHNMMKYSNIWANGGKKVDDDDEAIPWTASTSERSKIEKKVFRPLLDHKEAVGTLGHPMNIWVLINRQTDKHRPL